MSTPFVIGTTLPAWKCSGNETAWMENYDAINADIEKLPGDHDPIWFAALEVDARGIDPFTKVFEDEVRCPDWWTFSIDDDDMEINSVNRLIRICTGRNLIIEYARRIDAEWILFLDTDIKIPGDSASKLVEVSWPIVGGNIGQYGLSGPEIRSQREIEFYGNGELPGWKNGKKEKVPRLADSWRLRGWESPYRFPVEMHWNTAGFLLVHKDVWRNLRWRIDLEAGRTDDPCFDQDARRIGYPTLVRKDVQGVHVDPLIPVEDRPEDRKIYR